MLPAAVQETPRPRESSTNSWRAGGAWRRTNAEGDGVARQAMWRTLGESLFESAEMNNFFPSIACWQVTGFRTAPCSIHTPQGVVEWSKVISTVYTIQLSNTGE